MSSDVPHVTEMHPRREFVTQLVFVIVLGAAVAVLDVTLPADITVGVLYVIPIVACIGFASERTVYVVTPIVIIGSYHMLAVGPPPADFRQALVNRTLSALAQIGVAVLAVRQIRVNRESERQRRRLAQLSETKTEFVRAICHDIRGPVGAMMGYAELLLGADAGSALPEQQARFVRGIVRSGEGVLRLTENLLTAAKLEAEEFPVETVPFDLAATVQEIAEELGSASRARSIRIDVQGVRPLIVSSDPMRVRQIILNLVSNAAKFSPVDGTVRVDVSRDGPGGAIVRVVDSGPGIPAGDLERIFDPFYQTAAGRGASGFGLGLPLARRLARLVGGEISAHSEVGKGSEFTFRLHGPSDHASA